MVAQANLIALARVVGATRKATKFESDYSSLLGTHDGPLAHFETVEVLRGDVPAKFALGGGRLVDDAQRDYRDFSGHRTLVFWDKQITRTWNAPDCLMHPRFVSGRTYLIFLDRPHWRAYEEVGNQNDVWLSAVRRLIKDPSHDSGLSMGIYLWLSRSNGVFVGRIKSCVGPTLSVEDVLSGEFEDTWRYSNHDGSNYWPSGKCPSNQRFLVVSYSTRPAILPYYSASVFPIRDGRVDLADAIDRSEIEIKGKPIQTILDLKEQLAKH